MELTGAQALIKSLEMQQVEVMFGLPGGAILPVYDPIIDSSIRHILVRHEQGAGHMAEGYAQVTGRPGVAMVTSGPGATNVVTPLADAYMDSIPLVVITGQVATTAIGTDAFQESDITGITMGITKHNWLITDGADIPRVVAEAFHVATTGRPGPVLIDMPKDVADQADGVVLARRRPTSTCRATTRSTEGDPELVREAAELLLAAERPIIYAGGGILKSRAADGLRELAERTGIPVVTTLMARGCFPDSPPALPRDARHARELHRGHRHAALRPAHRAREPVRRPGDRQGRRLRTRGEDHPRRHRPGRAQQGAPSGRGHRRRLPAGDRRAARGPRRRSACRTRTRPAAARGGPPSSDAVPGAPAVAGSMAAMFPRERLAPWRAQLGEWQERYPLVYDQQPGSGALKPQFVLETLRDMTPDDTIVAAGVGQHQMFASQWWRFDYPYTWVNSGGLGTMGFAVPASIGAKVGRPRPHGLGGRRRRVLPDDRPGAGHRQLGTDPGQDRHPQQRLPRAWSASGRRCSTRSATRRSTSRPTCPTTWAGPRRWGASGIRVESPEEVAPAIDKANDIDDRPVVIDFRTDAFEKVFPMVAAGASNDDIVVDPSLAQRSSR